MRFFQFEKSQKMMRFRVAAQFFTIAVLVGGVLAVGITACRCIGSIVLVIIIVLAV
jgi:hypothetical protein